MFWKFSQVSKGKQPDPLPATVGKKESPESNFPKVIVPVPIRTLIMQSQYSQKPIPISEPGGYPTRDRVLLFGNKENLGELGLPAPVKPLVNRPEEPREEETQDNEILGSCPQEKRNLYLTLREPGKKIQHLKGLYTVLLKLFANIPISMGELELTRPEMLILNEILKRKNKDIYLRK